MRTNISKYLLRVLLVLITVTISGCNKFLEESPYDFLTIEDLDDSQESVNYLVTGVYSKWCNNLFRYDTIPSGLEKDSDYISGANWNFSSLGAGNFQASTEIERLWTDGYNLIDRCNTALEMIEPMQNPTDEAKANAIAEIYFNKAYMYFLLTRAFGEIPLPSVSTYTLNKNGESLYSGRESIEDAYNEIIRLLEYAERNLYSIDNSSYVVGHVASGTAAGMLAKVYATMASGAMNDSSSITVQTGAPCNSDKSELANAVEKTFTKSQVTGYENFNVAECYNKVIGYCEDLEAGLYGDYALLDFDEMWIHDSFNKTTGVEYMFTVYAVSADELYGNKISRTYSYTADEDGNMYKGLWMGQRNHWYMLFEEDDRRITDGVLHRWMVSTNTTGTYYPRSFVSSVYSTMVTNGEYPYNDGLKYNPTSVSASTNLAFTTKYFNVTDRTLEYSDAYFSMLRYADVLLLYAEALNETQTDVVLAKQIITDIRQRSFASASTDDLNDNPDREALRSIIIEERAKELSCEADRRWDLIRWGIYLDAMNAIGGSDECGIIKTREKKHLLYPIPVDEVLSNEFITENNYGWN